tara:strand:- start:27647 stop:28681 length:1035 start_codon:yes stop_codon:yes gene_type:complete
MVTYSSNNSSPVSERFNNLDKKKRKKRLLHERSHFALEFPQANNRVIRTFIPFLENPQITERGEANLNSYQLVGRAGELFSYVGAKSRRINLTFNINLLHLADIDSTEGISEKFKKSFKSFFTSKQNAVKSFRLKPEPIRSRLGFNFENNDVEEEEPSSSSLTGLRDYAGTHRAYYREAISGITSQELDDTNTREFLDALNFSVNPLVDKFVAQRITSFNENTLNDLINLVYCWVNLIRASVMNNSSNTLYGPPILRLTHGPMYNNVPCLVETYSIRVVEDAGYEVQTLTPRKLEVNLSLVESRTGNFGKYRATKVEDGDNITGWESIIDNNDLDPQNGLIGSN